MEDPATTFDVHPEVDDETFKSEFARTYLFDFQNQEPIRLNTYL